MQEGATALYCYAITPENIEVFWRKGATNCRIYKDGSFVSTKNSSYISRLDTTLVAEEDKLAAEYSKSPSRPAVLDDNKAQQLFDAPSIQQLKLVGKSNLYIFKDTKEKAIITYIYDPVNSKMRMVIAPKDDAFNRYQVKEAYMPLPEHLKRLL